MQGLIELASQLRTLKEKEARLKDELSNTRIQIKNIKKDLVNQMINYEVQNFKHNDNIFYLTTNIYVSDVASRREELYSTLRDNGFAIRTVPASSAFATIDAENATKPSGRIGAYENKTE